MMTEEHCGNCKYMRIYDMDEDTVMQCRRREPMPVIVRNNERSRKAAWPEVWDTDWCGKWDKGAPSRLEARKRKAMHSADTD